MKVTKREWKVHEILTRLADKNYDLSMTPKKQMESEDYYTGAYYAFLRAARIVEAGKLVD